MLPTRLLGDEATASAEHARNPDGPITAGWVEVRRRSGAVVEVWARRDASGLGTDGDRDTVVSIRMVAATVRAWLTTQGASIRTLATSNCATEEGEARVRLLGGVSPDVARAREFGPDRVLNLACRRAPGPVFWIQVAAAEGQDTGGLVAGTGATWLTLVDALATAARPAAAAAHPSVQGMPRTTTTRVGAGRRRQVPR